MGLLEEMRLTHHQQTPQAIQKNGTRDRNGMDGCSASPARPDPSLVDREQRNEDQPTP